MAESFIRSQFYFRKLKNQTTCRKRSQTLILALTLICLVSLGFCSTCASSSSNPNGSVSEQCSFSSYSNTNTLGVTSGSVSNSLYYLYSISSPNDCVIRKINTDGSLAWMTALGSFNPIMKSITTDGVEENVYIGAMKNPLDVLSMSATTGAIVDAQRHSFLDGQSSDIRIHILFDNSGYFVVGRDSSNVANICRYQFSFSSSSQCQQIFNFNSYGWGQVRLADTAFFMLGIEQFFPYKLYLFKIEYGESYPTWASKFAFPSGTCVLSNSESLLISSTIYSFFAYGSTPHLYLAEISEANGAISARYKSSTSCDYVYGSAASGDYIFASACGNSLLIFNKASYTFSIKTFSGTSLSEIVFDLTTSKFVLTGQSNGINGYITKLTVQSLSTHPDIQATASWSMNSLSIGTDDIILDFSQTIGLTTAQTISAPSPAYTNITVTYVPINEATSCASSNTSSSTTTVPTPNPASSQTSDTAQVASTATSAIVGTTTGVVVIVSIFNVSSISSLWITVRQLQLFFLLLLTRAFIPTDVRHVIEGSNFASNIYAYLPMKDLGIYSYLFGKFKFELTNKVLESFDINYDSTVVNLSNVLVSNLIMILFSLLVYLFRLLFSRFRERESCICMTKTLYWISDRLYRIMILGFFIRNALEISQFALVSSIDEINRHQTMNFHRTFSLIFALLIVFLYILMLIFILYLTLSSYRLNENEHNKLEEFFRGIKFDKKYRFYVTVLLLRKLLFVSVLISWVSISSRTLIIILSIIQVFYAMYVFYIRPYEDSKGNLIEVLNEIYFSFLIIFLSVINTENEWDSTKTSAYMWVLISNQLMIFLIVLIYSLKDPCKWIYRKLCKSKEDSNKVLSKQPQMMNRDNSNQVINMKEISPGVIKYWVSEHPIEEAKSTANMNVSENTIPKIKNWS